VRVCECASVLSVHDCMCVNMCVYVCMCVSVFLCLCVSVYEYICVCECM